MDLDKKCLTFFNLDKQYERVLIVDLRWEVNDGFAFMYAKVLISLDIVQFSVA